MTGLFNPDNAWETALLFFVALCSVLPLTLPFWFKIKKIDSQVSNSHEENLRDEITRGFKEVREDIRLLHEALNIERRERIAGDEKRCA
ncbi:hypothetical protein PBI_AN9_33 [Mycobacterium phage AN9]|nr:hypothetical protein PBI_VC3_33 [Mycobacterium phage VC3]QJD51914.1 hypothetical protein PBI_VA6_30 [Mycobacterium phage VA6]QJD52496.1 hypothetical protein PBI_ANI8_33 [Mycobacterium phage ANI8]QJD52588.1 hypothetical protein PBI_AN9_33 [Mycobacterium phage AN9]QJD52680.1 hypothetical protein PBI_AN3_30 [Mycobacterium phage AN3]BBC43589.1 putative minor tail protein [Mycobacterium phage C3]